MGISRENIHWWEAGSEEVHDYVTKTVEQLDEEQSYRSTSNLRNLRMYSNLRINGFASRDYADDSGLPKNRLTLNVTEAVTEALKAMIFTNRPKVRFLTEGGSFSDRQKARKLTDFLGGMFYGCDVYSQAQRAGTNGLVFGTGPMKIDEKNGDVDIEPVLAEDILVDDVESKAGKPRCLYHHKEVEKTVLQKLYPGKFDELDGSVIIRDNQSIHLTGLSEPVSVVYAWHLPSKKGGDDGRYVVCTSGTKLVDEKWREDDFPFAFYRWVDRLMGFWGKGVPEQLRGVQIEINLILQKVQRLMEQASSKVFIKKGSKVNKSKLLASTEWGVVEYAGDVPPVFHTVAAVAPEYYGQLESLYAKAFEIVGISQMAAQSKKPPGLESGKAIREYNDIQTQRFLHAGQAWERFFLDVADKMIRCAARIPGYKVMAESGDELLEIKWSEIDLDRAKFRMKAWPVSLLPDSPPGKLQTVAELASIDPRLQPHVLSLLRDPDLDAVLKRVNAPLNVINKIADNILEGKTYVPPEPYMNLMGGGLKSMQDAYQQAIVDDVEESKLELFRDWIDSAAMMIEKAQAAMAPPMPPPEMGGEPPPEEGLSAATPFDPMGATQGG